MSGQPFGDPNTNPYAASSFGAPGGQSPELLAKANSAFNLGIGAIVVSLCCCPIIGIIMGVMGINNAGSVLSMAPPGSDANSKASTAKIFGIIAIVIGVLNMVGGIAINMMGLLNQ
ncbi:MAG: hypothetical protein ACKVP0_15840 [Pirellulaceae bacterium]